MKQLPIIVLLTLTACASYSSDAEIAAARQPWLDCVRGAIERLDDGKSDPLSIAYGIAPTCAVPSAELNRVRLKGYVSDCGGACGPAALKEQELQLITASVLSYRSFRAQQGDALTEAPTAASGLDAGFVAYAHADYATALQKLKPLAEQGNARAQNALAVMYATGRGVAPNHQQALGWYRKAAEQGNAAAEAALGEVYASGRGVERDDNEAVRWYRKAAEKSDALGQLLLASMYEKGRGVAQDYSAAALWYLRAAEQGNSLAQHRLALMYAEGQGVPTDHVQADMWITLAIEQTSSAEVGKAREVRQLIEQSMSAEEIKGAQRLVREWKPKRAP